MENKSICKNPWCKATYTYSGDILPGVCNKCKHFDKTLSNNITWAAKEYTESKNDGKFHNISMNVKDYSTGVSTNQTINLGQGLNNFIIDLIKRAIK